MAMKDFKILCNFRMASFSTFGETADANLIN